MATILVNGCFDILHEGHIAFLKAAKQLGGRPGRNTLIALVNSDESARRLKAKRWGPGYPLDDVYTRVSNLRKYCDEVWIFKTEDQLKAYIAGQAPCILCKGPDYIGKHVTGEEFASVLILDTPEPQSVKEMKIRRYQQVPQ